MKETITGDGFVASGFQPGDIIREATYGDHYTVLSVTSTELTVRKMTWYVRIIYHVKMLWFTVSQKIKRTYYAIAR